MTYAYDEATLDLLRLTIPTYGIIVPIIQRSGTNEIIDGRHRLKIRDELAEQGIKIMLPVHHVDTDNPAEIDAIVNSIRRPWQDTEQRRELVRQLREKGHSHQRIADAVGTGKTTVMRDLRSTSATGPFGPVADPKPQAIKGKDGKTHRPPADPEEIREAWAMKDSGMSTTAIAKDIGRPDRTVRKWFAKERPEAIAAGQPPMSPPSPAPATPEPVAPEPTSPKPKGKPAKMPDHVKQAHQREQKWVKERWQPIAEHLRQAHDLIRLERDRLCREYTGPKGSLMMERRWQDMAAFWADTGELAQFEKITGEPQAVTVSGLLAELERSSRMANGWLQAMAMYTGCRPNPTRYQKESS